MTGYKLISSCGILSVVSVTLNTSQVGAHLVVSTF
jgi:hypothetical protein